MTIQRVQKNIDWSPADKARHKAIREKFAHKPTIEALAADGELTGQPMPLGTYLQLRVLLSDLRRLREESKMSLADLSERSGMDKAMLSRLETGHVPNPGIETISRYLNAMGKSLEWKVVDANLV